MSGKLGCHALPTEPADPEATAREVAALKEQYAQLDEDRLRISAEIHAFSCRKRHESHTPSWAAAAQYLIDQHITTKLEPTVMRQYTISQRLAQLGHKLE